jgi:hypothetical protein
MNRRQILAGMVVACALAAPLARAESSPRSADEQQPRYPITVRFQMPQESLAKEFAHTEGNGITAPSNRTCTVAVGQQTRDAYVSALPRAFRVAADDGAANGEVEVSIANPDIQFRGGGWQVSVQHMIILRADGREVGHWNIRADEPVVGVTETSLPRAFERAAEAAAHDFVDTEFEKSPSVSAWMRGNGVDLEAIAAARNPPRAGYAGYIDLGAGLVNGDGPSFAGRLGFAGPWYLVQIAAGRWSTFFAPGQAGFSDVSADSFSVGLEVGLRYGFGRWEIRGGGGPHLFRGHANQTYPVNTQLFPGNPVGERSFPFQLVAPSLFAALQYTGGAGPGGARLRFGLEGRAYIDTAVKFVEYGGESSIGQTTLNLFLGVELPVVGRSSGVGGVRR